jgi:AcrR family transcriptional regulator
MPRTTGSRTAPSPTDGASIRVRILHAAGPLLAADPSTPLARIAADAGVSRASFYRHFHSRAELLQALDVEPDLDARARILPAAIELLGRDGLRGLSMDEVAERAGVSRASVYRLFPGKTSLFAALLDAYAPFAELGATLHGLQGQPPEIVLPTLLATTARVAAPRVAIVRSMMLEVSAGNPEAVVAIQAAASPLYAEIAAYFAAQVEAGTVRPVAPVLAAQAIVGPLIFHLLSQSFMGPIAGVAITPDAAAGTFARISLHGLLP